jgi:hypothetical protein
MLTAIAVAGVDDWHGRDLRRALGSVFLGSYRVYAQADKQFRSTAKDMKRFYVRSDGGAMVPLDDLIRISETTDAAGNQSLQSVPLG